MQSQIAVIISLKQLKEEFHKQLLVLLLKTYSKSLGRKSSSEKSKPISYTISDLSYTRITNEKDAMNLKKSKNKYIEGVEGENGKENDAIIT